MSTSGGDSLNAVLYVLMLWCSIRAAAVLLGTDLDRLLRRPPIAAVVLWLVVAVPSVLQFAIPGMLARLQRDPDAIRHHGQWWRLVTAVAVQDGGVGGTVFNLAILAVIGVIAIRAWGGARAAGIFLAAVVAFDLATTFGSPSVGAGNSAATFALATSIVGLALVATRQRVVLLLGAVTAIDGIVLLALADAHGEVVVGGLVAGLALACLSMPSAGFAPTA